MIIEQCSVACHNYCNIRSSVYIGHLWAHVTLAPAAERSAVQLRWSWLGIEHLTFHCKASVLNLWICIKVHSYKDKIYTYIYFESPIFVSLIRSMQVHNYKAWIFHNNHLFNRWRWLQNQTMDTKQKWKPFPQWRWISTCSSLYDCIFTILIRVLLKESSMVYSVFWMKNTPLMLRSG